MHDRSEECTMAFVVQVNIGPKETIETKYMTVHFSLNQATRLLSIHRVCTQSRRDRISRNFHLVSEQAGSPHLDDVYFIQTSIDTTRNDESNNHRQIS